MPVAISIYNEFSDYMISKGIRNIDIIHVEFKYKNIDVHVTEQLVMKQFIAIHDFHQKALGFDGYLRNRINNNTGKVIEDYKLSIKRLAKDINNIKRNQPQNSFEELILKHGEEVISKGEECVRQVYNSDYIEIIRRSMARTEICLGNTSFSNLRKNDITEVVSFENCSYNMVEMDCFFLLSKLKRKGVRLDFNSLVKEFCYIEGLNVNSSKFLLALISYPYEFMKYCNKYREGKRQFHEENFSEKIKRALVQGDDLKR